MALRNVKKPKLVGKCVIVECAESRCPEYFKGICERCLDICAKENWLGWDKVENTGIDLEIWKDVKKACRIFRYKNWHSGDAWIFIEQGGRYHTFESQAVMAGFVLGKKAYDVGVHMIGLTEDEVEELLELVPRNLILANLAEEDLLWED